MDVISGKVILITGANRGIGKACVDVCLEHGPKKVYAAVCHPSSLSCVFADHPSVINVVVLPLDLTKPETIQQAAKEAQDVDIVIANAGVLSRTGPLERDAVSNLQHEMTVNVYGLLHLAQAFAPILQAKEASAFVQINSVASMRCGMEEVCTYSASKAAAFSVTQALRQAMMGTTTTTRVLSVHPGPIATDMIQNASSDLAKLAEDPRQVMESIIVALKDPSVFLVYPDSKSQQMGRAYESFAKLVIEEGNMYG